MALDHVNTAVDLELQIPSMTCAGCMRKVEGALNGAEGVLYARVNLTAHSVKVQYHPSITDTDALIDLLSEIGYAARPVDTDTTDSRERAHGRALLLKTGIAGFAAMNVMLLSISVWSGADGTMRDLLHWVSAMIALPAMAYAGTPFFASACSALKGRRLNMDVPISLALILSGGSSVFETANSGQHAFFDAGIMLVFFLLIGRLLEHHTRTRARSAAAELMAMTGRHAMQVLEDGSVQRITVDQIRPGMVLAIAPGDRIPADGEIVEGRTDLDRALITGESQPIPATLDDALHAGVMNLSGAIRMRITRAAEDSLLAEIAELVSTAQEGKGRYDRIADRVARYYAPVVHILAAVAFVGWITTTGDARVSLQIAVAVLIITCPCALALAVPTVHTVATGRLFRTGIFLKDGAALERLGEVDTIIFDKTGTLTDGHPRMVAGPAPDDPAWPVACALAAASKHPFSKAILAEAKQLGVTAANVQQVLEQPGDGMSGRLSGGCVRLGRPDWIGGATSGDVLLEMPDGMIHGFTFSETLRPGAADTCAALSAQGYDLHLLSGDGTDAVVYVAEACAIPHSSAELTPTGKHAYIEALRQRGRKVLMVGDGLNDNPALAAAHASMSPATAMDATQNVADLVFTSKGLAAVETALHVARTAQKRSFESFGIAAVYNVIAIPLAFTGYVVPLVAALAMSGSSILVILNALRLRRTS